MPKRPDWVGLASKRALALASQMDYTLVDVELVKESTGRFLRFYIDKDGGVSLDDCEAFHRRIAPQCEDIDYDYMEVSSPGVDRPLKRPEEFERALGAEVEVRLYKPVDGARTHTGALTAYEDGGVTILCKDGMARSFERAAVALVKPVFDFDEEMLASPDLEGEP